MTKIPDLLVPPARMDDNQGSLRIAAADFTPQKSRGEIGRFRQKTASKFQVKYQSDSFIPIRDVPRDFNGKLRKRAKPSRKEQLEYDQILYAKKLAYIAEEADKIRPIRHPAAGRIAVSDLTKRREIDAGRPKAKHCEVCNSSKKIVWDHCHTLEKFRGWICSHCNTALGMVKDNPTTLRALADYLEKFNKS